MYNVGFGDCFCLRDRNESLLIDFGTSNSRIEGHPRKEVFDVIISDLTTMEKKNLLLTHFHMDHLSGLLYMIKRRNSAFEFEKIYLPDVFSRSEMNHTLTLLLLADMMKDSYLPNRQVSLFALVEALCKKPQKLEFLSRGKIFEKKYQALWPDTNVIENEAEDTWKKIAENHEEALLKISGFAEKLRMILCSMDINKENTEGESEFKIPLMSSLNRELRELRATPQCDQLIEYLSKENLPLRQFTYKISIVFQNARDSELNRLFTGDIPPEYMQMIAENYDGQIPLYDHYWCIKIPHHGTQDYYFDFSSYTPENMMISNGEYYSHSKKKSKNLRTSPQYAGLFYINDTHMYCANSDCCDGFRNGCTCKESDIISPSYYKDI
jgi:hypothetical protein